MAEFKRFGVMLDMSRNAVMRVDQVKRMITLIKKMGYNALGLYIEDTYEIEGEPYFGYLRGRYTVKEIKEIDEFALANGVELIPHIQTLAHLNHLTRHRVYSDVFDMENVLLIDEPKTYELIDKMFKTLSEGFSSRVVNIGMDEAFGVGRGKYLDKHGYCDRYEMLTRHLNKVSEIASKYGFTPHMWSDMFFRIAGGDYVPTEIPEKVKELVPENVGLAYWDYYHKNKDYHDQMFKAHKSFGREVWFAGGAWSWYGFAPLMGQSFATMQPAIASAVEHGVENVMITMWGDGGRECSFFSLLNVLYAIRQYGYGNYDLQKIKQGFKDTMGLDFDGFMTLELPNMMSEDFVMGDPINPCRIALYSDPFMGSFDKNIAENQVIPFDRYAERIKTAKKTAGEFSYVFDTLYKLCKVCSEKSNLGIELRSAYKAGDKKRLAELSKKLPKIAKLVEEFHSALTYQWHFDNKPHGFEVQDARLGGLIQRLKTCKSRLDAYLKGKIDKIEELEDEILSQLDGKTLRAMSYRSLASMSTI